LLGVPLLREGRPIGVIGLARRRVEACTDKEIELVRTFADQAVIAIENTRLLTELRESLEQQQAIAEVLQVINASQGNLQPVFEAMVEKARRLCEADSGHLALPVGDDDRTAAVSAMSLEMAAMVRAQSYAPGRGTAVGRALLQRQSVQIVDIGADLEHAAPHASRMGLISAVVGVPLLREGEPVGAFGLTRREAKPFAERQIELVRTFAAQAVIAIDNARLLQELRQRQAELRVTFDNMGDGVAMFDAELRLAAWNRNFQEILDLPDEFFAQPPTYDGFIRYLALRGEYGDLDPRTEIARLRAEFGDHFRFERIRPDGAILEVRHNPVPGGGFVLMYSDVTERKRAEEEIRIARDTAENALAELKTTQASLIHSEKMASLGQLTGVIGPIDWRHRPRDQEPVEFRQQLCRAVDRIAG
jgi:GAF domain-containing protein